MNFIKKINKLTLTALIGAVASLVLASSQSVAHKDPHDSETLKAFNDEFMAMVVLGDRLYHGDPAAAEEQDVNLSKTGMACAMCHPIGSDIHPRSH